MMNFVAIDVETANADYSSICQIGMARYVDGALADEWETYVDPEDMFDPVNIAIHGITPARVRGAPTLPCMAGRLHNWLDGAVALCHTHFDRVAVQQACIRYRLQPPACTWLDSARVARRTWAQCAYRSYGLGSVCCILGYEFRAHDALEDAKAAGHILLQACSETGLDVRKWLTRVEQRINLDAPDLSAERIAREGNPEGPLFGEVLVFTGTLNMSRRIAADVAAGLGCKVHPRVTKHTTILVVGDQDVQRLAGHEKSAKHRKTEELALKGQPIRIIGESDFLELARLAMQ